MNSGAYLVTGASGFVGRAVRARLSRDGIPCVPADRDCAEPCDICDPAVVARLFQTNRIGTVIHLAAMLPSACRLDPPAATRVNVLASVNLLEAAVRFGVRRFVFASSMSAAQAGDDLYGSGKRYIEAYGQALRRLNGISFAALRIATVIGAEAKNTASPWRSAIFETLGSRAARHIVIRQRADAVLSLVHVDDVARMLVLMAAAEEPSLGLYDSPAEAWRVRDLKAHLEELDSNLTVDLDEEGALPAAPVADGTAFIREFEWQAPPLADRWAACLLK